MDIWPDIQMVMRDAGGAPEGCLIFLSEQNQRSKAEYQHRPVV